MYGKARAADRYGSCTTEIIDSPQFYFAED